MLKKVTSFFVKSLEFGRFLHGWWYDKDYIEDIRETYTYVIHSQSAPAIHSLNRSVSTRFYNQTVSHLLDAMFVESAMNESVAFDTFYSECAPLSCSYKMVRRREILVALLLFISVCGGLNRGLRLLIPLLSKCTLVGFGKWRNRNNARRQYSWSQYV